MTQQAGVPPIKPQKGKELLRRYALTLATSLERLQALAFTFSCHIIVDAKYGNSQKSDDLGAPRLCLVGNGLSSVLESHSFMWSPDSVTCGNA